MSARSTLVTRTVLVTVPVDVTLDESKFTPEFLEQFRQDFYDIDTIDGHAEHLAQMYARDVHGSREFIDGYGPTADMGIKMRTILDRIETEIER